MSLVTQPDWTPPPELKAKPKSVRHHHDTLVAEHDLEPVSQQNTALGNMKIGKTIPQIQHAIAPVMTSNKAKKHVVVKSSVASKTVKSKHGRDEVDMSM